MAKRFTIVILLLVVIFGGVFSFDAWRSYMAQRYAKQFKLPPVTVGTIKAQQVQWSDKIAAIGTLVAMNSVKVTSDINGKVSEILFESGQMVDKDQPIIKLDDKILQQQLRENLAQLELSRLNFTRSQKLYQKNTISQQQLDVDRAAYVKYQAAVDANKINLDYKIVKAPFSGRLGIREVNVGQYLDPGDPIVSLETVDPILIDFSVPERYLAQIKVEQPFTIKVDAYPNEQFQGKVIAINSQVNKTTRNITLRGKLNNPDSKLHPGQFANVSLDTGKEQTVVIVPRNAIAYNTYGSILYVVATADQNSIAKQVIVKIGLQRGDWVVITDGINTNDEVVVSGQIKLRANSPVVINNKNPLRYKPW